MSDPRTLIATEGGWTCVVRGSVDDIAQTVNQLAESHTSGYRPSPYLPFKTPVGGDIRVNVHRIVGLAATNS